jgi:hypothetical protein
VGKAKKSTVVRKKCTVQAQNKKMQIHCFSSLCLTTLEIRIQSPRPFSRGKARVLGKMYIIHKYHFLFFHGCCPVQAVLSQLSCPNHPVAAVLLWLSCPSSTVLTVLCRQPCSICSVMLSCSGCLVLAVPFWLSNSHFLVLADLF